MDLLLTELLVRYDTSICSGCGQPYAFSLDPLNTPAFHVDASTRCIGCEKIEDYHENVKNELSGTKAVVVNDF